MKKKNGCSFLSFVEHFCSLVMFTSKEVFHLITHPGKVDVVLTIRPYSYLKPCVYSWCNVLHGILDHAGAKAGQNTGTLSKFLAQLPLCRYQSSPASHGMWTTSAADRLFITDPEAGRPRDTAGVWSVWGLAMMMMMMIVVTRGLHHSNLQMAFPSRLKLTYLDCTIIPRVWCAVWQVPWWLERVSMMTEAWKSIILSDHIPEENTWSQ